MNRRDITRMKFLWKVVYILKIFLLGLDQIK